MPNQESKFNQAYEIKRERLREEFRQRCATEFLPSVNSEGFYPTEREKHQLEEIFIENRLNSKKAKDISDYWSEIAADFLLKHYGINLISEYPPNGIVGYENWPKVWERVKQLRRIPENMRAQFSKEDILKEY